MPDLKPLDLDAVLDTARRAAFAGGAVLKRGFDQEKQITLKGFADPVTQFDKESESEIVQTIQRDFPEHSILTEEELSRDNSSPTCWIIDPLDGTVNFTHRIPYICVSIAVEHQGELVLGIIYNPILDEFYEAVQGRGAILNGHPIRVSEVSDIGQSLLATGFPYHRQGRLEYLLQPLRRVIMDFQGFRRLGSAAMDLAYVACGKCEGFYEEGLQPWDTAAGTVLVREAGGLVSAYGGETFSPYQKTILASNPSIHPVLAEITQGVTGPV